VPPPTTAVSNEANEQLVSSVTPLAEATAEGTTKATPVASVMAANWRYALDRRVFGSRLT
jgi:hypothetical protein